MTFIAVKRLAALGAALTCAACSLTADVTGYVGSQDQVYRGKSTGYSNNTGKIEMTNAGGVRCFGDYVW